MKIVISCSGSKNGSNLVYKGNEINFVSSPDGEDHNQFKPGDRIPEETGTWRDYVKSQENDKLLKAYELYKPSIYKFLFEKYNTDLYILSAGWGLINAEFRIPKYDITFSKQAAKMSQRGKNDFYNDFNHLKGIDQNEKILFFGGSDYIKLFYELTRDLPNQKVIFYNKKEIFKDFPFLKDANLFRLIKYKTKSKTNWHYECAKDLLNDDLVF